MYLDGFKPVARDRSGSIPRKLIFYGPLALQLLLSLILTPPYFGLPSSTVPWFLADFAAKLRYFRLASDYHLYRHYIGFRHQLDFQGSDDGGRTWRTYQYRYLPQDQNQIVPFIAPYFTRYEAAVGLCMEPGIEPNPVIKGTAAGLLTGSAPVLALFKNNPFPDHPPDRITFPLYDFKFTTLVDLSKTGHYWTKKYIQDYMPEVQVDRNARRFKVMR